MDKNQRHQLIEKFISENRDNPDRYMVCPPASEEATMMSFKERDQMRKDERKRQRRR